MQRAAPADCLEDAERIADTFTSTSENLEFDSFVISTKCNCLECVRGVSAWVCACVRCAVSDGAARQMGRGVAGVV